MAYIAASAILTRVREVLEDSAGTLRTVPAARFLGDLPEGLSEDAEALRAISKPRVEAAFTAMKRSAASSPVIGSLLLYDVEIAVRIVRVVTTLEQLSDDDRVALQALALEDCDVVRQALEFPGNLTSTTGGTATGLCSGLLRYGASKVVVKRAVNDGAQPIETVHTFTGVVQASAATS